MPSQALGLEQARVDLGAHRAQAQLVGDRRRADPLGEIALDLLLAVVDVAGALLEGGDQLARQLEAVVGLAHVELDVGARARLALARYADARARGGDAGRDLAEVPQRLNDPHLGAREDLVERDGVEPGLVGVGRDAVVLAHVLVRAGRVGGVYALQIRRPGQQRQDVAARQPVAPRLRDLGLHRLGGGGVGVQPRVRGARHVEQLRQRHLLGVGSRAGASKTDNRSEAATRDGDGASAQHYTQPGN